MKNMIDEAEYTVDGSTVKAELRHTENKPSPHHDSGQVVRMYSLLLKTQFGQFSTRYWGSIQGFREQEDPPIDEVVSHVAEDALTWWRYDGVDEFAEAMGYGPGDVTAATEAWEGCESTARGFSSDLSMSEDEVLELVDEIRD